jgi:PAS domain S-box-containing protein
MTDRISTEEVFQKSEERFRNLFESHGAIMLIIDPQSGEILDANVSAVNFYGYTKDELRRMKIENINRLSPEEVKEEMQRAEALNRNYFIFEHTLANDSVRTVEVYSTPVQIDNRKILFSVIHDISERKAAEEALRDSEASLKRSQQIAHLGSWELDLVANRLSWSDELYRIFGQQPQEFGATYEAFLDHVHPDDRIAVDAAYKGSLREGRDSYEIEHRVIRKTSGEIRLVHEKCYHVRDENGKIIRSLGMTHDITDRKRAELELRESRERFAAAFRTIQDALIISDLETGLIIDVNQMWVSHWGYSAEESIGHRSTDLGAFVNIADRERVIRILQKEGRVENVEISLRTRSGEIRDAVLYIEKLMLPRKPVILTIIHDITERKRALDALQFRTEELETANRELESFSYSVSHDLRTPLNAIKGFSYLLQENYSNVLDENGRDILNHLKSATERMALIMADLLRLAHISQEDIDCQEIDLNPIADCIINELRQAEPNRNVQFQIAGTMPANADERLLTVALSNLIENAWKYTGKNPNARIDIGMMKKENENVFFIHDNGVGFDMNLADKLFQPFQRLHSDIQFAGTGIGLAIVHRIIERHGGRIWVESEPGKGTEFYFTLNCTNISGYLN